MSIHKKYCSEVSIIGAIMHSIISRDIRRFIHRHGRYRFTKLYELIQKNASLDHISDVLDIDHISIMHWKTIFEMIGSDGLPEFQSPARDIDPTQSFELIVNEQPNETHTSEEEKLERKKRFTVY